jgi:hypothetical protein
MADNRLKRAKSNPSTADDDAEPFNRTLLVLASAFLGGSLAFIGQVVDMQSASPKGLLYLAWTFFGLTIVATIGSFLYGQFSLATLDDAGRSHSKSDKDAQGVAHSFIGVSGALYVAGIAFLVLFVAINLPRSEPAVGKPTTPEKVERPAPPPASQQPVAPQPPAQTEPKQ